MRRPLLVIDQLGTLVSLRSASAFRATGEPVTGITILVETREQGLEGARSA
jgi:hypothetical protein